MEIAGMTDAERRKLITKLVGIDITAEDAREGLYDAAVLADKAAREIESLMKERDDWIEKLIKERDEWQEKSEYFNKKLNETYR